MGTAIAVGALQYTMVAWLGRWVWRGERRRKVISTRVGASDKSQTSRRTEKRGGKKKKKKKKFPK
jgi:hypothetical protein